ncbi:MAG: hypothetical protein ACREJ3_14645 [Polyangiaceae bacterium]
MRFVTFATIGLLSCALSATAACGGSTPAVSTTSSDGGSMGNQGSGSPPPGYVRFTSDAVTVPADSSKQWIQWVQAPLDHDVDIVDIQGSQSPGGHHAVLYSTTDIEPVGTMRVWKDSDIVTAHFLGGIGGEGGSALKLPEGAVFRLRAGQALALQVHYLNATTQSLQGTTRVDVEFAPPSPTDRLASLLTNTALTFSVPAHGKLHVNVSCKLTQDVSVLMYSNHLHQWGTSALTTLADTSGAQTVLKSDPSWNSEWTTNPNFTKMTVDAPLVIKAGETLSTSCDWSNTTSQPLAFPSEMCVFLAFYLGDTDVGCVDNGAFAKD